MRMHRHLTVSILALSTLLVGACVTTPVSQRPNSFSFDPDVKPPKNPGNVSVKISTSAQRLYVVEGDDVLLATPVSIGKSSSPTPAGNFKIYSKQKHRRRFSNPGAGYPMPFWMEFKPAYGMHWGFLKPYPNTMGCVRMPLQSARKTFDLVRVGTPLNVSYSQPWDQTIGSKLPSLDDSALPNPPLAYMLSPKVMEDVSQGRLWRF